MALSKKELLSRFRDEIRVKSTTIVDPLDNYYQTWAESRETLDEGFLKVNLASGSTLGDEIKKNPKNAMEIQKAYTGLFKSGALKTVDYKDHIEQITANRDSYEIGLVDKKPAKLKSNIIYLVVDQNDFNTLNAYYLDHKGKETHHNITVGEGRTEAFTQKELEKISAKIFTKINENAIPKIFAKTESPDLSAARIQNLKEKSLEEIKEKQKDEIQQFEQIFAIDPNNPKNNPIQKDFSHLSDTEAKKIHIELLQALKQKHAKELEAFEKTHNDVLNNLYNELNSEMARISFMHQYANKDKKNSEEKIEAFIQGNRTDLPELKIKGLSGDVTYDAASKQYKIEWKKYQTWYSWIHPPQDDIETLALAIKAQGHDSITLTINHPGQQTQDGRPHPEALKLGRKAYDAARKAGFEPDKIAININGKVYKQEELFGGYKQSLDAIEKRARLQKEEVETHHQHLRENLGNK